MADQQKDFFIAISRRSREKVPANWLDIIGALEGVQIVNATQFRARIKATPEALTQIRQQYKDALMVEEIIERKSI